MKHVAMQDEDATAPLERLAYSVREAAEVCGLSRQTLYRLAREGKIELKKVGTRTFILREELLRFLEDSPPQR